MKDKKNKGADSFLKEKAANEPNFKTLFDISFKEGYLLPAYNAQEALSILTECLDKATLYDLDDIENSTVRPVSINEWEKFSGQVFFTNVTIDGISYIKFLGSVKEVNDIGKGTWVYRQYKYPYIKEDDWMNLSKEDKSAAELFGESDYVTITKENAKTILEDFIKNAHLL